MFVKKCILSAFSYIKKFFSKQANLKVNIVQLSPNELLKGRCALITGGTSGIGFSIADAMLRAGAEAVVITGREQNRLDEAVNKLLSIDEKRKGKVFAQVMDVRKADSFESAFKEIQQKLGERKISILCNNAGVQGAKFGSAKEGDFDNVMDTNYKGAFFLSQLVAAYMIDNKIEGNILNIASSSSIRPMGSAYALSKACIKEMTEGLAKYLIPYDIVVNGLAPGPTATPLMNKNSNSTIEHPTNPSGRFAVSEEIAQMAVVLTSGMGRMIVGSIVYMTGGAGNITYDDSKYIF